MKSSKKIKLSQIEDNFSRNIIRDLTPSSDVTGTVSEVLLKTYLIPANTFKADDVLTVKEFGSVVVIPVSGSQIYRLKVGTINDFSSAVLLAQSLVGGAPTRNVVKSMTAHVIRSGLIRKEVVQSSVSQNYVLSTEIAFDPTVDNYLFTSLQNSSIADSIKQYSLIITN